MTATRTRLINQGKFMSHVTAEGRPRSAPVVAPKEDWCRLCPPRQASEEGVSTPKVLHPANHSTSHHYMETILRLTLFISLSISINLFLSFSLFLACVRLCSSEWSEQGEMTVCGADKRGEDSRPWCGLWVFKVTREWTRW